MTRKLKICYIAATSEGATWMVDQLRVLRDVHGFEVAAVVSADRGGLIDRLKSENIPFHVANFQAGAASLREMLGMPLSILRLARFLRRERFDVVQTHIFKSMVIGRPAAWLVDAPVRLAMIAGPFHLEAHSSRWIERTTHWMDTQLIPACHKSLSLCRELGISEKRLAPVIYYSPDPANFDPSRISPAGIRKEFGWPADTPLICHVAYFYPRLAKANWIPNGLHGRGLKGHGDLIRSMPTILREFPAAKLMLVGIGWTDAGKQYMEEMRALVREMNLEANVVFTGYRADANRILREADVAVQPSLSENCGGAFEALLLEKPLVVTDVGGLTDVVRDQETGLVVQPSDPNDLARGILELLRAPEKARAFGKAGRREMLQNFTIDRTASDLSNLHRKLIEERRGEKGYHLATSVFRALAAAPIFTYMIFRLVILDMFVPMFVARGRAVAMRLKDFALRQSSRVGRVSIWGVRSVYVGAKSAKRLAYNRVSSGSGPRENE
jgi:glycosyltransferase involved in cell wall biosynthesis